MEDRRTLPGRAVAVGQGGDAAGGVHGLRAAPRREVHGRGGGPHERTVSGGVGVDLEVAGGGEVPRVAAEEHLFGLEADVLGVGRRPAPEAVEDVRQVEAAPFEERFPEQNGHLRVVRRLARVPAAASAQLADAVRETLPEDPGETELEGGTQGVTRGGAQNGAHGAVDVRHRPSVAGVLGSITKVDLDCW